MRKWTPAVTLALAVLLSAVVSPRLPETLAVHWDLQGSPDGWGPKWFGLVALPILMLVVFGIFHLVPRFDPMRANLEKFWPEYETIIASVSVGLLAMHAAILGAALGYAVPVSRVAIIMVGMILMILGNVLPRFRRNHVAGIRTPATLSSDEVWTRTHRTGGRITMITGLLIVASAFAPVRWGLPLMLSLIAAMTIALALHTSRVTRSHGRTMAL